MRHPVRSAFFLLVLILPFASSGAEESDYAETIKVFREAGQSGGFFGNSYGYAVFPTIGKGGIGIGGAFGK